MFWSFFFGGGSILVLSNFVATMSNHPPSVLWIECNLLPIIIEIVSYGTNVIVASGLSRVGQFKSMQFKSRFKLSDVFLSLF